ncbi:SAV_2336 N-terminal domain-related protein [Streptomyces sp. RTGN2]|uniref:SAV_2336 N-terminal domain-related protein n=1 Tax=Streptomyces sp. RTGN2 TaxID=3016525 RepID=UPI0025574D68|nr:SAV_2336 N-terminal domain-related protein [Streptomyces sp. RTGN2]
MRDLAEVLDALLGVLPPDDHDATLLADALWIAAASFDPSPPRDAPLGTSRHGPAEAGRPSARKTPAADSRPAPRDAPEGPDDGPDEAPDDLRHGPYGLYEHLPEPLEGNDLAEVSVASVRALPRAVELGRALRPFMRRFPRGRRTGLDLAATIDMYTREGELLPVVGPLPEPWFDVLLVIDTHPSMQVWHDAIQEFATLLSNSGAFRQVRQCFLSTEPHPDMTDGRGRVVNSRTVAVPDQRRLVLVLSDCAAPAWYGNEMWQLLRTWAAQGSVSIVNPLPSRLWHRTALDLPAVRVHGGRPGASNTLLSVTVPPHLRAVLGDESTHVAIPTLTLTTHSLNRWARGLARGAPEGYEAVLVLPFGAPEDPFASPDFVSADGETDPRNQDHAGVGEAFIRTASPPAVKLAALCSAIRRLSLSLIQLIRQEVVPEATSSDVAELLMSDVLDISGSRDDPHVITFREQARAALSGAAGRHDTWLLLDALSRYVARQVRLPGNGLNAIAALDTDEMTEDLRPFAYASEELVNALRIGSSSRRSHRIGSGRRGPRGSEGTLSFLPDPLHSAALLIGAIPADSESTDRDEVEAVLGQIASLMTSPEGWNLPSERCVRLVGAQESQVRRSLNSMAAMADEALLVWFVGRQERPGVWLLGTGSEQIHPLELLSGLDVAHLLVVADTCPARPPGEPGEPGGLVENRALVTAQWFTYDRASEESPAASTTNLLRAIEAGVANAPPLLTLLHLVQETDRSMAQRSSWRSSTWESSGSTAPALVRNRAVTTPPRKTASDASVLRLVRKVLDELQLAKASEAAAAERVLDALIRLLAARVASPRPDRSLPQGADEGTFRAELEDFLGTRGLDVLAGTHFSLLCRFPSADVGGVVPMEVLNFDDASRWVRPYPDASAERLRLPSFAVLLVLEGSRDARRQTLTERVKVTRSAGGGLVTLHFPTAPPAPVRPGTRTELSHREIRADVIDFCASAARLETTESREVFLHLLSVSPDALPRGLSDTQLLTLRPSLAKLHLTSQGDVRELSVPTTAELAGLLPTRSLGRDVTVLSGTEVDSYAFVKVELPLVLVFAVRPSPTSTVELLRIEATAR